MSPETAMPAKPAAMLVLADRTAPPHSRVEPLLATAIACVFYAATCARDIQWGDAAKLTCGWEFWFAESSDFPTFRFNARATLANPNSLAQFLADLCELRSAMRVIIGAARQQ